MTDQRRIACKHAGDVAVQALMQAGVCETHARVQVDLLLEAELRGRPSHGFLRLPRLIERIRHGVADPRTTGLAHWRADAFLQVDGEQGLGPVVAFSALRKVTERAKATGVAVASITNNNHLGMLALYAERVASGGQVVIALTTSEALVHPWGGRRAMVGTNPIAIGVPASPSPFVLDMATGLISMGQVHDYANRGQALEPGWALDEHGDPTLDAGAARNGSIAPFGGPKGYALGLSFEVLVAALTGSALGTDVKGTLDSVSPCNKGDVFIVLEPARGDMTAAVSEYLDALRACAPATAGRPVTVPGDRAAAHRTRALHDGIGVEPELWHEICQLADPSGERLDPLRLG